MEQTNLASMGAQAHNVYSSIMPFYFTSGAFYTHTQANKKKTTASNLCINARCECWYFVFLLPTLPLSPPVPLASCPRPPRRRRGRPPGTTLGPAAPSSWSVATLKEKQQHPIYASTHAVNVDIMFSSSLPSPCLPPSPLLPAPGPHGGGAGGHLEPLWAPLPRHRGLLPVSQKV